MLDVTVIASAPVAVFFAVTVTPGRTAVLRSVTRPVIVPILVCAIKLAVPAIAQQHSREQFAELTA